MLVPANPRDFLSWEYGQCLGAHVWPWRILLYTPHAPEPLLLILALRGAVLLLLGFVFKIFLTFSDGFFDPSVAPNWRLDDRNHFSEWLPSDQLLASEAGQFWNQHFPGLCSHPLHGRRSSHAEGWPGGLLHPGAPSQRVDGPSSATGLVQFEAGHEVRRSCFKV